MPWIESQEAAQAAVNKLRQQIETAVLDDESNKTTFEMFELLGCLSPIKSLFGVSYFWQVQTGNNACVQLRIVQVNEDRSEELGILAIKVASLQDKFEYLDPRDGYVQ